MSSYDMTRMPRTADRDPAQRWTTMARRIAARTVTALIVTALAGCKDDATGPLPESRFIAMTPPSQTLSVGDSASFRIVYSFPGDSAVAICGSSDTTRVTTRRQPARCQVFALAPGMVTITAFLSSGQAVAAQVTVVAR
jgi:hypothetical protein